MVLTGGPGKTELAETLVAAMRRRAVNLVGRTSLWTLGALVVVDAWRHSIEAELVHA